MEVFLKHGLKGVLQDTYYDFKVQTASITKLCKTSTIVTVNGMYPGPAVYAGEDDRVVVKVTNLTPYNISIHWHGFRQRLTCWFDGPSVRSKQARVSIVVLTGEYWIRDIQVSLLNAYYNNLEGYYNTDFPAIGTQVSVLEYGWAVQVIFQDTGIVGTKNHPIYLHGFSFYLLGTGLGNFNSSIAILNLYDPPYRNTIVVPVGGWAVIRFRTENPGEFA
ncbi:hypothetical protein PTKIN_Ptkin08bG0181700 [Pterospermum kingtungense]